jgi:hypothetical protein
MQDTWTKYCYHCSYDHNTQYLISWLELHVPLKKLNISPDTIPGIRDNLAWFSDVEYHDLDTEGVELNRVQGTLVLDGISHTFTPFP